MLTARVLGLRPSGSLCCSVVGCCSFCCARRRPKRGACGSTGGCVLSLQHPYLLTTAQIGASANVSKVIHGGREYLFQTWPG
jgi:hypothetical protein